MTKDEQAVFIETLVNNVKDEIISNIYRGKVPKEWDGHELREYLAEKFEDCRSTLMRKPRSRRRKEYRNTVLVSNL